MLTWKPEARAATMADAAAAFEASDPSVGCSECSSRMNRILPSQARIQQASLFAPQYPEDEKMVTIWLCCCTCLGFGVGVWGLKWGVKYRLVKYEVGQFAI